MSKALELAQLGSLVTVAESSNSVIIDNNFSLGAGGGFSGSQIGGTRNMLDNGNFLIFQRGLGPFSTSNNTVRILDRWSLAGTRTTGSGILTAIRDSSIAGLGAIGAGGALKISTTTQQSSIPAAAFFNLYQSIEMYTVARSCWGTTSGKPAYLSFWVRSSVPGKYSVSLIQAVSPYRCILLTYNINSANTWEYKTIFVPAEIADPNNLWNFNSANSLQIRFDFGSGSNSSSTNVNSWGTQNFTRTPDSVDFCTILNAEFYLTNVQLEIASTPTPFEYLHQENMLKNCLRHLYITQNTLVTQSYLASGGQGVYVNMQMPTFMRTTPNVILNVPFLSNATLNQIAAMPSFCLIEYISSGPGYAQINIGSGTVFTAEA